MPSIRKRIGYLPSLNIQEIITSISKREKLSQSKVVGLLVEEALIARGIYHPKNTNDLIRKNIYRKANEINDSSLKYIDLDELISDKGITYKTREHTQQSNHFSSESKEVSNEDLFELFKKFIMFQKMIKKEEEK